MERTWWTAGALLACAGVAAGAFGAHGLKERLGPDLLATWEVGVRYHIYHALALLAVGALTARAPSGAATAAGWLFLAGIVVFSGSLYVLALTGARAWGAVTPFGGVAFLAGWVALAVAAARLRG